MSDLMARRLLAAVATALIQAALVGTLSLMLGLPHVWPGCLLVAGTGLLWGYRFADLLVPDRRRS